MISKIYGSGVASVWESSVSSVLSTSAVLSYRANAQNHAIQKEQSALQDKLSPKAIPSKLLWKQSATMDEVPGRENKKQLDKKTIIEMVYRNTEYRRICLRVCGGDELSADLYQEMILALLNYEEEKIMGLHQRGELKWFITRIMMTMWRCKSSPFFQAYRRGTETVTDRIPTPDDVYDIDRDLHTQLIIDTTAKVLEEKLSSGDRNDWYEATMWKLYTESGSFRKAQERSRIPYKSIANTVRRMKLIIAKRIELEANGLKANLDMM
jgi:DNA-directed RNA polymerase specialized sigma24 family protein